jgi:hypothetical protein
MRSVLRDPRRRAVVASGLAGALAVALLGAGCSGKFDGPYPCVTGYASCVNPAQNQCETRVTDDSLNCGSCGNACSVGAWCADSQCGSAASQLAPLSGSTSGQPTFAANSTAVFWGASNSVWTVPIGGGTPTPVANNLQCSVPSAFAVDDEYVYYWAGNLVKIPLSGQAATSLTVNTGQGNCPSMAVDATNLYTSASQSNGSLGQIVVSKVPIAGGDQTVVASLDGMNNGGLVVTGTDIILPVQPNSSSISFAVVPLAGGSPRMIEIAGGENAFAADASSIYYLNGGCPCDNNNSNNGGGDINAYAQVTKVPLDGSPVSVLATVTGLPGSIAVDADDVYWSTDVALWKVPLAGGQVTQIAGNLGAGAASYVCSNGVCGIPGNSPQEEVAIALGATDAFLYDQDVGVSALLRVAK